MHPLKIKKIYLIIFFFSFIVSFFQLLFNRSLWVDEAMLALNIITKTNTELLAPLDLNQVAPILFLQIESFFSSIIQNEIGLRIFPFISFIISTLFFTNFLKFEIKKTASIIGVSLFAFNPNLIYFSTEVKQYICDILVISTMYYLLIKPFKKESKRLFFIGLVGMISVFLSNVTPIILLTSGIFLLIKYYKNPVFILKKVSYVFLSWLISFSFYFFKFVQNHPSREKMLNYWEAENAFLSNNLLSFEALFFLIKKLYSLIKLVSPINNIVCEAFILILLLLGTFQLIKTKNFKLGVLIFIPILTHLILSYFKLYPFETRLILYFIPCLVILITLGFVYIFSFFSNQKSTIFSLMISFFLLISLILHLPIEKEEIKSSLTFFKEEKQKNEKLYVYYGAENALKYYKQIGFFNYENIIFGTPNRENKDLYIEEIINLKKDKIWLLFSHNHNDEENYIIEQIKLKGIKVLKTKKSKGSSIYLIE